MAELSPYIYKYGRSEGRIVPAKYTTQDGRYAFVLGTEDPEAYMVSFDDYVEVNQMVDLTSFYVVCVSASLMQPALMPAKRTLPGATLKHSEVLFYNYPSLTSEAYEPYKIVSGDTLIYQMTALSGGVWGWQAPITVTFLPADAGIYEADELVALLNPKLTNASVSTVGTAPRRQIKLRGSQPAPSDKGRNAAIRVVGGSLCNQFRFPLGSLDRLITGNALDSLATAGSTVHLENGAFVVGDVGKILKFMGSTLNPNGHHFILTRVGAKDVTVTPAIGADESGSFMLGTDGIYSPRVAYGGDDLSALILPAGQGQPTFSAADIGQSVEITGASNPTNNIVNRIIAVPNAQTAILNDEVVTEGAGFTATVLGALWQAAILIDDVAQFTYTPTRGRTLRTNDIAVNVSKLVGEHKITFRLDLLRES